MRKLYSKAERVNSGDIEERKSDGIQRKRVRRKMSVNTSSKNKLATRRHSLVVRIPLEERTAQYGEEREP